MNLSDYRRMKLSVAATCNVPEDAVKMHDNPGMNTPFAFIQPSLLVWLPKSVDLSVKREQIRSICRVYANGYTITVDHDPESCAEFATNAQCACGQTNDYAAQGIDGAPWQCTGCRLWAHVAGPK